PGTLGFLWRLRPADTIVRADPVALGDRVSGVLQLPEISRERLDGRRRIEDQLGTLQAELSRRLRKVPVVADQDADPTDRCVPHRVAEVAGLEIELLPETWADVRDVRLAVLTQYGAVVLDQHRGVVVDAGLSLLVERYDQRQLVLVR